MGSLQSTKLDSTLQGIRRCACACCVSPSSSSSSSLVSSRGWFGPLAQQACRTAPPSRSQAQCLACSAARGSPTKPHAAASRYRTHHRPTKTVRGKRQASGSVRSMRACASGRRRRSRRTFFGWIAVFGGLRAALYASSSTSSVLCGPNDANAGSAQTRPSSLRKRGLLSAVVPAYVHDS